MTNEEKVTDCEVINELEKEYKDFIIWAFGDNVQDYKNMKKEAIEIWKKWHPNLPVPRIFKSEYHLGQAMNTICFFMDAYPYYLREKNNEK